MHIASSKINTQVADSMSDAITSYMLLFNKDKLFMT